MEEIKVIRDLENDIITNIKATNSLLIIRKKLNNDSNSNDVRLAALSSMRRIFIKFIEEGRLVSNNENNKVNEYSKWLRQQYQQYLDSINILINTNDDTLQAPAIRTMLEFVKREYLLTSSSSDPLNNTNIMFFGINTYSRLIKALMIIPTELSAEILLLLKDEVFCHPDCCFFALLSLKKGINIVKENISKRNKSKYNDENDNNNDNDDSNTIRNTLYMLRMININDDEGIDPNQFLINGKGVIDDDDDDDDADEANNNDDYNDTSSEDEKADEEKRQANVKRGRQRNTRKTDEDVKKKKQRYLSRHEQLHDWPSHRKIFSSTWLAFLSLPLTATQHKTVLKHLPDHVICYIDKPLLLADYLTKSYEKGGITSVLALESLFHLIIKYNLDYPNFFTSLYKLCTEEVFGAKYRLKFMNLLNACLKSTNLPAYMVASFIKKLAHLALRSSSPSALYCIAQLTWLLQKHPQCKPLLHQHHHQLIAEYDEKITELEKNNALSSSLWEIDTLKVHNLNSVASLSKSLEEVSSTEVGTKSPYISVPQYIDNSYASLMEKELGTIKKNSALAFKKPDKLIPNDDVINLIFQ